MTTAEPRLLPFPRQLTLAGGTLTGGEGELTGPEPVLGRLRRALQLRVGGARIPARLVLEGDVGLPAGGYTLEVADAGVTAVAGDEAGLHHAVATLDQLLGQYGTALPCGKVRDWPDLAHRGLMLDISRDRVPTMDSLRALIERMASLKLNELQLYTEHTFAYRAHERVWRDASPLTASEIRDLDTFAAGYGIELVPNQNSFGHMERWLRHAEYRHLSESADGPGSCLAPGDDALAFMQGLYEELLPCFRSRSINVGCDETFALGSGRSAEACEQRGKGRVYLEFLLQLVAGLHGAGREVQFWGDIIEQHPELIAELPEKGLVALAWHYEEPGDPAALDAGTRTLLERIGQDPEGTRGFGTRLAPYARSGRRFRVCPGTSSWNSLLGRWRNARENLLDAARAAREHGAEGMLITDWGDNGHMQPPQASWLPLAYGAAVAWSLDHHAALPAAVFAGSAFPSAAAAEASVGLGELYRKTGMTSRNASPLAVALLRPLAAEIPSWVLGGEPDPAQLGLVIEEIDGICARLGEREPDERALRQAAGLARHGALRLQRRAGAGPSDAALRDDLSRLIERQREEWLRASRPGGLGDSLARLEAALADYGG